jgi:hypothetical protein
MRSRSIEVHQAIQRLLRVAVPEQVFDALDLLRRRGASLFLFSAERLRLLLQNRQPHRDVEPVDQMLAVGVKVLLYTANVFAAIGHEDDLLILLHAL